MRTEIRGLRCGGAAPGPRSARAPIRPRPFKYRTTSGLVHVSDTNGPNDAPDRQRLVDAREVEVRDAGAAGGDYDL